MEKRKFVGVDFLVECMAKQVFILWCTEKKKKSIFVKKLVGTLSWDSVIDRFIEKVDCTSRDIF